MIVVVIMAILALAAVVVPGMRKGQTALKHFAFNLRLQGQRAKYEAVKRGRKVYMDFDFDPADGTIDNGYTIWADENRNGVYDAATDTVIKSVTFENRVSGSPNDGPEIYCNACGISGGPGNDGCAGGNIGDGVSAAGNAFVFNPDGTASGAGTVYFYLPDSSGGNKSVAAGPWALIVSNVGRIRLDEWRSDGHWYRWQGGSPVTDD